MAGAVRIGNTVAAALTNRRVLEPVESHIALLAGAALLVFAMLAIVFPRGFAYPIAAVGASIFVPLAVASSRRAFGRLSMRTLSVRMSFGPGIRLPGRRTAAAPHDRP